MFGVPKEQLWGSDEDKQQLSKVAWSDLEGIDKADKDDAQYLSVRELMQIFATEVCRSKIPDVWYKYLSVESADKVVISDLRFENDNTRKISAVMTTKNLVTVAKGTSLKQAEIILQENKIEKLPVVDADYKLVGLITFRDIIKVSENARAYIETYHDYSIVAQTYVDTWDS